MPLNITDEELRAMRMDEAKARIEIACRLFDAGLMSFGHAAKLARITEAQLESEIATRDIPRYRYTQEMLRQDMESLNRMDDRQRAGT